VAEHQILDKHLAEWLAPVTVSLTAEELAQRRAAVVAIATDVSSVRAEVAVRASYGDLEAGREWLCETVRATDSTFVLDGKDALLSHLAAAGIATALTHSNDNRRLLALLVQSAEFAGMKPSIGALSALADDAAQEVSRAGRQRNAPSTSLGTAVAKILKDAGSTAGADIQDWDVVSTHLGARDKALQEIAKQADQLATQVANRLDLADEEMDILWWSYSARSSSLGETWSDIKPPERRAVIAAAELRELARKSPSLPGCRSLLALALGNDAREATSIGDLAGAVVDADLLKQSGVRSPLLPIASCADARLEMGGDDDTWVKVVERTARVDATRSCSFLEGAEQWMRETEIRDLL
jgi:hypothetical protein